jgi:hypothetical protein
MLVQLIYASTPITVVSSTVLDFIPGAIIENAKHDITGMLISTPTCYVQILEGERKAVNQLYQNIVKDNRHINCTILRYASIPNKEFKDWSMIHTNLHELKSAYIDAIFDEVDISPEHITSVQSLSLIRYVAARVIVDNNL